MLSIIALDDGASSIYDDWALASNTVERFCWSVVLSCGCILVPKHLVTVSGGPQPATSNLLSVLPRPTTTAGDPAYLLKLGWFMLVPCK